MEGANTMCVVKPCVIVQEELLCHENLVYYVKEKLSHHKTISCHVFS